jgi:ATP-dependent RNA helicase DHX29
MTYLDATGKEVTYSPSTLSTLELLDPAKINYELIVELVKHIVTSHQHAGGSILIFLSGMQEISTLIKELKRDPMTGNERQFCLYPLHSLLSSAEQQRVFEIMPAGSGRTKVVISTNLAETSLTIEDVTVVIDSGSVCNTRVVGCAFERDAAVKSLPMCSLRRLSVSVFIFVVK